MPTRQPAKKPAKQSAARKITSAPAGRKTRVKVKEIPLEEIRKRAYEIYRARGGRHGQDLEDWLQAEQELQGTGKR